MTNSDQLFYEYFQGDYYCGDAVYHLRLAMTTLDAEMARKAGMRCFDYARHLETRAKKDPARKPAPESVVETQTVNNAKCQWTDTEAIAASRREGGEVAYDEFRQTIMPAAETEVPADWPEAVKEIRSGNPNSAMVAEVQRETVSDGMGSVRQKCHLPDCDLPVVRPGKSQCSCETSAQSATIRTDGFTFAKHNGTCWMRWAEHSGQWEDASAWLRDIAPRWIEATAEQLRQAGVES